MSFTTYVDMLPYGCTRSYYNLETCLIFIYVQGMITPQDYFEKIMKNGESLSRVSIKMEAFKDAVMKVNILIYICLLNVSYKND